MEEIKAPWLSSYGDVKFHLEYSRTSMSQTVLDTASTYPDNVALSFMGHKTTYFAFAATIDVVARAFRAMGITEDARVCICMPNVPQTVYALYALNRVGAVAVMVHPLSAEGEICAYLKETDCDVVLTLDQFYPKFLEVQKTVPLKKLVVTGVGDALRFPKKVLYKMTVGRKMPSVATADNVITWRDFIMGGLRYEGDYIVQKKPEEAAVILFSGGTSGVTKGILLSNLNFNALALQTATMCNYPITGKRMLAAMPMFHGFGLGVCVHTMLVMGGTSILVPRFTPKQYAELIVKEKPNYIAGVPTLFEAITRNPYLDGKKLDSLMGVFSGGDSLSIELKKKFDAFLADHGATVRIREGYGTTECVTASCLTPYNIEVEGSIGLPYPDTYYKICKVGATEEVPYGEDGEICLTGPSVMIGYLGHPEENAQTLRVHEDGHRWLHTGDLGCMDERGFIYFKQRIKRMIITSGYNVYPSQIENILESHEAVQMSCVIGVKDPVKMQKV
ncbi:MAG: AMP-binding protein, partial [Clostridia bacterium]|nr:AMP-binding protein [Clostridia bacterium]